MRKHVVKLGECVESIAHHYGLDWESLWNRDANANLKKARRDPNLLCQGDIIYVPEPATRQEYADTGGRYRFVRRHAPSKLQVQFLDNGEPLADEPYSLEIETQSETGQTDSYGEIAVEIDPEARTGILTFDNSGKSYILQLGCLGPIDEVAGYQARLQNLGYYEGKIDGIVGDGTINAIASFQRENDLEESGSADAQTLDVLKDTHGV